MKVYRNLLVAVAVCLGLGMSNMEAEAALLSVDFGTSSSPVAPGFVAVSSSPTVLAPYTVSFSGIDGVFDAGSADPLLRDFIYNNSGGTITLDIDGLSASTQYLLTVYAYQEPYVVVANFAPGAGTSGPVLNISNNGSGLLTAASPSVQATGAYTSNGSGNLKLLITGTVDVGFGPAFGPRINGFVLDAVPEPSSFGLLAVGLVALCRVKRRTR